MPAFITEDCVCCDACLPECPSSAIVDDSKHPKGAGVYYVDPNACTECGGDEPACVDACPSDAIVMKK